LTIVPKEEVETVTEADRVPLDTPFIGGATPIYALVHAFNQMATDAGLSWKAEQKSHGTKEDLINCIKAGYLVTVLLVLESNPLVGNFGGGHYILIVGYDELSDTIYFLDPADDNTSLDPEKRVGSKIWSDFEKDWSREEWWSQKLGYKNEMIIYKPINSSDIVTPKA
jgi:hypothetical protein